MLKKSIFIAILVLFTLNNAMASEEVEAIDTPEVIELNLPDCADENLIKNIRLEINKFYDENPTLTPYKMRKRKLALNSFGDFYEVGLKSVDTQKHSDLARKIIMTKINSRLSDSQMRLCKTGNEKTNIYILIVPNKDSFNISVFGINTKNFGKNIKFTYKNSKI